MSAPVVCHGDLHPFNLLVDGDRVMLIDWTNSRIADPTFDLAFTHLMLTEMPVDVPKIAKVALGPVARSLGRAVPPRVHRVDRLARSTSAHSTGTVGSTPYGSWWRSPV